ncbi:MAG TPA: O-antigen ligase family protein [Pyrinomonadaceae bacterium]|nr:O-antigen ligase family protein [Pyrinomonadaceae bacterium]
MANQSDPNEAGTTVSPGDRGDRVLTLLDQVIFYGLIVVIGLTAIPYGSSESWSKALFESVVFFLALLWIVHGLIDGSWRIGNARLLAPLIGLLMLAVVQSFTWRRMDMAGEKVWFALSSDPFETRIFAFRIAALILVLGLIVRFTSNLKRLGILVHAIIAVAVSSALFGIARQAAQQGAGGPGLVLARLVRGLGYAQFTNKNHFPFLMEMALGLVIGIALMQRGRLDRLLLYLSVGVLICAAVALSRSRGGLLAITVQIILAGLLFINFKMLATGSRATVRWWVGWARSIIVTTVIAGALLVFIAAGVAWLGGDQLSSGIETATSEMSAADPTEAHIGSRRRDIWRATWSMLKAHPIAGAGLGAFWAEVPVFHQASGALTPQQAHNDYLELLASGGILGAALFIWFAVALIREVRRSVRTGEGFQRAVSLGAIIGLVGVAVHSIVDFGLHITINALVFVVLAGILSLKSFGPQAVRSVGLR